MNNNEMIDRGIEKCKELRYPPVRESEIMVSFLELRLILEAMKEKQICPLCKTQLVKAPGIGYYCPNKECIVSDDADLYEEEATTKTSGGALTHIVKGPKEKVYDKVIAGNATYREMETFIKQYCWEDK